MNTDIIEMIEPKYRSNKLLQVLAVYICVFYPLTDLGISNIVGWAFLIGYWLINVTFRSGKLYITSSRLAYFWIVLVVLVNFIMPNARNDEKSTQALIINMMICVLYVLSARITKDEILTMMKIFVIFSLAFSFYIIVCRIFPNIYLNIIVPRLRGVNSAEAALSIRRGYGAHIANSITFGPYIICMGIFFCIGDLLSGTEQIKRKKAIVYILVFVAAVLCEGRRSELLATILTAFIVYLISTPKDISKVMKRFGVFLLFIFAAIVVVSILLRNGYLVRYVNTANLLSDGLTVDGLNKLTSSRYRLWLYAWDFFKSSPIFGIGWSSFTWYVESAVDNVHNCYLQFLCEIGIVGFAALMAPMIILLVKTIKTMKAIVKSNRRNNLLAGNAVIVSAGMQILFFILYAMDPVFYKGYYHMLHIILIIFSEYAIRHATLEV